MTIKKAHGKVGNSAGKYSEMVLAVPSNIPDHAIDEILNAATIDVIKDIRTGGRNLKKHRVVIGTMPEDNELVRTAFMFRIRRSLEAVGYGNVKVVTRNIVPETEAEFGKSAEEVMDDLFERSVDSSVEFTNSNEVMTDAEFADAVDIFLESLDGDPSKVFGDVDITEEETAKFLSDLRTMGEAARRPEGLPSKRGDYGYEAVNGFIHTVMKYGKEGMLGSLAADLAKERAKKKAKAKAKIKDADGSACGCVFCRMRRTATDTPEPSEYAGGRTPVECDRLMGDDDWRTADDVWAQGVAAGVLPPETPRPSLWRADREGRA